MTLPNYPTLHRKMVDALSLAISTMMLSGGSDPIAVEVTIPVSKIPILISVSVGRTDVVPMAKVVIDQGGRVLTPERNHG